MQVVIDTQNTTVQVKDKCFFIQQGDVKRQISPKRISSIAITSNSLVSASAIILAAQHQIPLLYFNRFGSIQARLWSPYFTNIASLRRQQMLFYHTNEATRWVIEGLVLKLQLQEATLKKLVRQMPSKKEAITILLEGMHDSSKQFAQYSAFPIETCRNTLMGIEGNISRQYLLGVSSLLPEYYSFEKRSRRPAHDYFNAALNYMYGMTYSVVESAVFTTGLDPFLGFMHIDNYKRTSLVFDMIEPFRPLIDQLLINLCIDKKLLAEHFVNKGEGYWLSKVGKSLIIPLYNENLGKRIKFGEQVRTLKDHMYAYSDALAKRIRAHHANEEKI